MVIEYQHPNSKDICWLQVRFYRIGSPADIQYVITLTDRTQEHHANLVLQDALVNAQNANSAKRDFLSRMSHEIRTPLNAVVGFSNLLARGDADISKEEAEEYAALISKNCDYLLTLVSDILDLSRFEAGSMEFCFTNQPLGQILSDIHEKYADRIPEEVKFNLLVPPNDIRIDTDVPRLRQVIEHLVGNSVKFTKKGHIDLGYSLTGDGKEVRLFVTDTGCGIPSDMTEKVFDRFYKIDSFKQGAGLGLSVCKTIIEGMGGRIAVSSQPGKGSRFSVKIPMKQQK